MQSNPPSGLQSIGIAQSVYNIGYILFYMIVYSFFRFCIFLLVSAVHKKPRAKCLLVRLLVTRAARPPTKDKLAPEFPFEWNLPVLGGLLVNDGVVVLKVGTEALGLEGYPESVLVHGVGVLRPVAKVVRVDGCG